MSSLQIQVLSTLLSVLTAPERPEVTFLASGSELIIIPTDTKKVIDYEILSGLYVSCVQFRTKTNRRNNRWNIKAG